MSKMGQELDRRLDYYKYEMYASLKALLEWAELSFSDDKGEWADENDPAIRQAKEALAKINGGE